jgi:ribosomal RNA-processing protein 1
VQDVGEDELKKIWKGLFYCLWHSDKAHVQGDLINKLAGILESLDADTSLAFFEVFLTTMRREWGGIDRLRLDKFYRLLRQFLTRVFTLLQKSKWDEETIGKYMNALVERSLLANDQYPALGVNLHFVDIFLTELRKFQPLSAGTLRLMLQPCYAILASSPEKTLLKRVKECVFMPLLEETQIFVKNMQDGSEVDKKSFGPHVVSLPLGARLFDLASLESTPQANRKVLYDINAEYAKLDKLVAAAGIDLSSIKIGGGCNSDVEMAEVRSNVPTRQSARQAGKRATMEPVDVGNGVGKKRKVKEIKDVPTPYDNPTDSPILNLVESSVSDVLSINNKKKNQVRLSSKKKTSTSVKKSSLEKIAQGTGSEKADVEQNDDQIVKVVTEKKKKGKKNAVTETAQVQASSKKKGTKSVGVGKGSPVPAGTHRSQE